ncbi:hypothetical protein CQA53_01375 [Helicobacter didelphidarum]|uniref:Outer membrane family protein n=1 Tax=Helicobacter didelphidarum TaxID=2040648 RepID=A0A3D8IQW0_9HELI|nr:outer membrane family protein [Helicobacter didelphidarum]RDU67678.1 hypothetical protein CQA53_01375 [Helicobacter didelphidarum]
MKIQKFFLLSIVCSLLVYANNQIQDEVDSEEAQVGNNTQTSQDKDSNGFFLHGGLEVFNRTSFSLKQIIPSNSYGYVLAHLSGGYHYKGFEVVLGAVSAGLSHDTSNGLGFNYVGNYVWYNLEVATANTAHRTFVHNAHIKYENDMMSIKAGRFLQENDDWFNSYAEGINAVFKFANHYHIKLFGTSSLALVGYGWLNDFSRAYSTYGIVNAEIGYENDFLKTALFAYYGYKEYIAPGLNLELYFGKQDFIAYTTKINALFPIHSQSIESIGRYYFGGSVNGGSFNSSPVGFTSSILVRQDIDFFDTYKIALAVYKNIGNANARMGLFGNPIGIDVFDNSVYEHGTSLNASVAPDALSALIFTQAKYENLAKYVKSISVGLDGRYTTSPSADEYSIKLNFNWGITKGLSLGLILNYYTHTIKNSSWYNGGLDGIALNQDAHYRLDRSYLMSRIAYEF